jgi:glycine/D-amino acid oxidase-like deaminating enzyme
VKPDSVDVAVIGAGNIGIAVAYYLVVQHGVRSLVLIDAGDPMALTSAQSGENYRNWWPHPAMTAFTDHSIDLLEDIARVSGNRIHMTRRGYLLVTRRDHPADLLDELRRGYGEGAPGMIRIHEGSVSTSYQPPDSADWQTAPGGVDVLLDKGLIRSNFPSLAPDVASALHIRRAGDISGQQLGQWMLEAMRAQGITLRRGKVVAIEKNTRFTITLDTPATLRADRVVNAAGPYFARIGAMLGEDLPVHCVYQQKIAFEDREAAIPRRLPFTIDLDGQELAWTEQERELLAGEPEGAHLLRPMPGAIHRRPDGGDGGRWIKLGWAYNTAPGDPDGAEPIDPNFPDVVLRGASRLNPALQTYIGRLPRGARHYGGYYTMTPENWPLIGPMRTPGAYMAGALSGFGTMAAAAAGSLCAGWMSGAAMPGYAKSFTFDRYANLTLMAELRESTSKGVL